jgi:hypothetical protein
MGIDWVSWVDSSRVIYTGNAIAGISINIYYTKFESTVATSTSNKVLGIIID